MVLLEVRYGMSYYKQTFFSWKRHRKSAGGFVMLRFIECKILVVFLLISITGTMAYGRDFTARKKVEGYTIEIAINRNPPIVAKNELRVEIKDPQGKPVNDLTVMVNYYMPPMPGMAPMNYTVKALPKSNEYMVIMDLIMAGPWNIVVKTSVAGKRLTATFPIDVR
jgi:hypothetical protein